MTRLCTRNSWTVFTNEAKTIAGLSHDHIVKVYDFEERYRTLFIISIFLDEAKAGRL